MTPEGWTTTLTSHWLLHPLSVWPHSSASLGSISHLEMSESSSLFPDGSKGPRLHHIRLIPTMCALTYALFLERFLPLFLLSTPIHLPIPNSCIFEGYLHHPPSVNTSFQAPLPKHSTLGSSLDIQYLTIALIILSKMWHLNNQGISWGGGHRRSNTALNCGAGVTGSKDWVLPKNPHSQLCEKRLLIPGCLWKSEPTVLH